MLPSAQAMMPMSTRSQSASSRYSFLSLSLPTTYLSTFQPVHPSIHPSIHPSVCLFVCLSIHPSIYLSPTFSFLFSAPLVLHLISSSSSSVHAYISLGSARGPLSRVMIHPGHCSQVVCELGVNHASVLAAYPQTAIKYMMLMNRLASHPCVRIPAMTLSFWGSLVEAQRNMRGKAPSFFTSEYRSAFVGNWVAKMVSPTMTELDEIEFVDEEEWKASSSASQVRFLDILRKMSSEQPREMIMQVGGMWQQLLLSKDCATTQSAAHGGSAVSLCQITAVHRLGAPPLPLPLPLPPSKYIHSLNEPKL